MGIYKKVPRSGPILVQKDLNVGAERLRNCLATNCNCFFFYTYHDALRTISKILESARYNLLL